MIQVIDREYFDQTYIPNQEFIVQKGVKSSKPETDVKYHSTERARTNYPRTPQGVLDKPYEEQSYENMKYHFKGYPGTNLVWFDSKIGGHGVDTLRTFKIIANPKDNSVSYLNTVPGTPDWDTARNSTIGNGGGGGYSYYDYVSAEQAAPLGSEYKIKRFFVGFNLYGIDKDEIESAYILITSLNMDLTTSRVCFQASTVSPYIQAGGVTPDHLILEDYSRFYGAVLSVGRFGNGQNKFVLNKFGISYLKKNAGIWAMFCIREYDHDYLNVPPGSDEHYVNYFYTGNYSIESVRPTLIIN